MAIGERESKQMEQNPSQHGGISGLRVAVWLVTAGGAVCGAETSLTLGAGPGGETLSTELNPSAGMGWVPMASSPTGLSAEGLRGPQFLDSVRGLPH